MFSNIEFDPKNHTFEYLEQIWGITEESLLYKRMYNIGLRDDMLLKALWASAETCHNCFDGEWDCQCINDE